MTTSKITRPMLAETIEDVNSLKFPVLASPKLDGIRCVIIDGCMAVTRSFKPIPNNFIRNSLEDFLCPGLDGEIVTYSAITGEMNNFNTIQSEVMSVQGEPKFKFMAFDYVENEITKPFQDRLKDLASLGDRNLLIKIENKLCNNVEELLEFEVICLNQGYEGVTTRDPNGGYKCGRSSLKQAWLLKLKRFIDAEAVILELSEQMTNTNEKTKNELGLSKRSSKKEGMVPAGRLGEFLVRDVVSGVEFKIGTGDGLTLELRQEIWDNKEDYVGKLVKYKCQPSGAKDKPRFPVWLGFRNERDM
jgi:DNA ligase-1